MSAVEDRLPAVSTDEAAASSNDAACAEAGDLLAAVAAGVTEAAAWTELGTVVEGVEAGAARRSTDDLTLFKSVGLAAQDTAAAAALLAAARAAGLGHEVIL